MGMTCN